VAQGSHGLSSLQSLNISDTRKVVASLGPHGLLDKALHDERRSNVIAVVAAKGVTTWSSNQIRLSNHCLLAAVDIFDHFRKVIYGGVYCIYVHQYS
jgi:hypothetical protein